MKLDDFDKQILSVLQENGRITNAKLAADIGMSPSPMLERVKKLERTGVIHKYVALVNPEKVGKTTIAFVAVSLAVHQMGSLDHFTEEIRKLPEVMECYHISGDDDFILKVMVESIDAYREFVIDKLTKIGGISKIRTSFVLQPIKYTTRIEVK